jgi:hypothetical protein
VRIGSGTVAGGRIIRRHTDFQTCDIPVYVIEMMPEAASFAGAASDLVSYA